MNKLAAALILLMLSGDVLTAHAQPATQTVDQVPPTADQLRASVPGIKKAILAATGYDDDTVELVATDMDFVVTLPDRTLPEKTKQAKLPR
jgi:ABC-type transporter Mla subunit MlaD